MNHLYIAATIVFAVLSQLIMRWQVGLAGTLPENIWDKCRFIAKIFSSPWVMVAFLFTFLSGVAWMMALTKFELSYAYPFTSLCFIIVLVLSVMIFNEPWNAGKLIGTLVVIGGLVIITRS